MYMHTVIAIQTSKQGCPQRASKSFTAPEWHMHTRNISAFMQCQSFRAFNSALFFYWLGNRARPLIPIPPSNPLSFNNGPGQTGGSAGNRCAFYQSQTKEQHSPLLKVYGSCFYLCIQQSMAPMWGIRNGAWWSFVQLVDICAECGSYIWESMKRVWTGAKGEAGTWRSEIRLRPERSLR